MVENTDQWIETSDVLSMFPTLIWKIQLKAEFHEAIDAKIVRALERMRQGMPELAPGQGWQSDPTLHELEEIQDLISCINRTAKSVLQSLRIGYASFEITGCWANLVAEGAAHKAHSHPNNFLSGVYYVRTKKGWECLSNLNQTQEQVYLNGPPQKKGCKSRKLERSRYMRCLWLTQKMERETGMDPGCPPLETKLD